MDLFETIISILAGVAGIIATLFLIIPFSIRARNWIWAEDRVFHHLSRSIFQRNNRWCTEEYISQEEKIEPKRVKTVLRILRSKGLVISSGAEDNRPKFWTLSDSGVEKYMSK